MTRLYLPLPLATGETIDLPEAAVRHVVQVLRMGNGEQLSVFNGQGGEYRARLQNVARRSASLLVEDHRSGAAEPRLAVTLGQCISKGDRMDYAVQKATELGVARIVPLISERGVVKLAEERWEKKTEHWRAVAVSAAEQCGRTTVPEISEPERFDMFAVAKERSGLKLILAPGGVLTTSTLFTQPMPEAATALIGPEGGFSELEVHLATRYGWQPLALGERILRTETAPVALLASLLTGWQAW